jgi:Fic family protein
MVHTVHTFRLQTDWNLVNAISKTDRFDASWVAIEKKEGKSLKHLKTIATVRSVGASTRIEGSALSDQEVEILIKNLAVSKLDERDEQEVAGYFTVLNIIEESYATIDITESNIKNLHNLLLKYSVKDEWHRGGYKQLSNAVEATTSDGRKQLIFKTTEPGIETAMAMQSLIEWYAADTETHPLVKSALFSYDFVSIHPFQDGNGRLSRLLATLLLLKHGYNWIQYVSLEHEIENKKSVYYKVLMECQQQRPGEDVYAWVMFFLQSLNNIQDQLMKKLEAATGETSLSPRDKSIYIFIENNPGCKTGIIARKLNIPLPTVKKIVADMVTKKIIVKHGLGAGTNYSL